MGSAGSADFLLRDPGSLRARQFTNGSPTPSTSDATALRNHDLHADPTTIFSPDLLLLRGTSARAFDGGAFLNPGTYIESSAEPFARLLCCFRRFALYSRFSLHHGLFLSTRP